MKRIISTTLAAFMLAGSITACAPKQEAQAPAENKPVATENALKVVTTIFPPYDFTKQIAKDKATVSMLLPPGSESHSFEPSPQDIINIEQADLFIYNGGDSDHWVDEILESMGDKAPDTLKMMDIVNLLEEEVIEGMEPHDHDHDHGHDDKDKDHDHSHDDKDKDHEHNDKEYDDKDHEHNDKEHDDKNKEDKDHSHDDKDKEHDHDHDHEHVMDEHVWTSPKNAVKISEAIASKLSQKDSANAQFYIENLNAYKEELNKLDKQFEDIVANAKIKTMVFGDRFPLRYFAHDYNLNYYAAFVGCSTQSDASAATVAFLIDKVKEEKIPTVFHIELSAHKIADAIADSTGAEVALFHSCHNLSKEDFDAGKTYVSLMQTNAETLKKALQ
ncbi:MAG: metal ABC transporter substrate-binding protein [Peptostreptococcaceae bacterium]|nr:metal ABC transporter substrate-binding protein [Peptostreptococcaceae bacterium]